MPDLEIGNVRPNVRALTDDELAELAGALKPGPLLDEVKACQAYRAKYLSRPTA